MTTMTTGEATGPGTDGASETIGTLRVEARYVRDRASCEYRIVCEYVQGPWAESLSTAFLHYSALWKHLRMNVPHTGRSVRGEPILPSLLAATNEELQEAGGMWSAQMDNVGMAPEVVAATCPAVIDALASLLVLPEQMRQHLLEGADVRVDGSLSGGDGEGPFMIALSRRDGDSASWTVYRWKAVPGKFTVSAPNTVGQVISVQVRGLAFIPEKHWEGPLLASNAPPQQRTTMRVASVGDCVDQFCEQARSSAQAEAVPVALEHAPLLAYCAGVTRWLIRSGLRRVSGNRDNPWYVLGLALMQKYAIDTNEKIQAFGASEWDRLEAIVPVDVPEQNCFPSRGGSDNN